MMVDTDKKFKHRQSFATTDLTDDEVQKIGSSRMHPRHAHLDIMLEPEVAPTGSIDP
jgi:hypothetical protein